MSWIAGTPGVAGHGGRCAAALAETGKVRRNARTTTVCVFISALRDRWLAEPQGRVLGHFAPSKLLKGTGRKRAQTRTRNEVSQAQTLGIARTHPRRTSRMERIRARDAEPGMLPRAVAHCARRIPRAFEASVSQQSKSE